MSCLLLGTTMICEEMRLQVMHWKLLQQLMQAIADRTIGPSNQVCRFASARCIACLEADISGLSMTTLTKSSLRVQQMQPFVSSTICSCKHRCASFPVAPLTRSASMLTSAISLTITATCSRASYPCAVTIQSMPVIWQGWRLSYGSIDAVQGQ